MSMSPVHPTREEISSPTLEEISSLTIDTTEGEIPSAWLSAKLAVHDRVVSQLSTGLGTRLDDPLGIPRGDRLLGDRLEKFLIKFLAGNGDAGPTDTCIDVGGVSTLVRL